MEVDLEEVIKIVVTTGWPSPNSIQSTFGSYIIPAIW